MVKTNPLLKEKMTLKLVLFIYAFLTCLTSNNSTHMEHVIQCKKLHRKIRDYILLEIISYTNNDLLQFLNHNLAKTAFSKTHQNRDFKQERRGSIPWQISPEFGSYSLQFFTCFQSEFLSSLFQILLRFCPLHQQAFHHQETPITHIYTSTEKQWQS